MNCNTTHYRANSSSVPGDPTIKTQAPTETLQSLTLSVAPHDAARVSFAPKADAPRGAGGRAPRGESRYVDPYSGALLGKPRGEGFFRVTMQLHRWLALDELGKQIVGFSTIVLVYFCLSGLYLRWPRRWRSPRTWLALDWRQKGRNFLWHLHSVVGTWVLVAYLIMALTGLWWSYDWYREALNRWADMPVQQRNAPRAQSEERKRDANDGRARTSTHIDIAKAWIVFGSHAPAWKTATMQWPRDGNGVQFRYLNRDAAHERANNSLELDPQTLAVRKHERYVDRTLKQRLVGSIFALHRGSYFGILGVTLFMLASLLMPLFTITGWMLYLDRRRKKHAARDLANAQVGMEPVSGADVFHIVHASQTGTAERIAWQSAAFLHEAGCVAEVQPLSQLEMQTLASGGRWLFVVSTFGEGQPPDSARAFVRAGKKTVPALNGVFYGLLALGDREYGEDYCGFGREFDRWLQHAGAEPLFDRVDVDGGDESALRHWQHHLGQLIGRTDLPDWNAPSYQSWTLIARQLLNPGSAGGACFHLAFEPTTPTALEWQAGDIAEIGPQHALSDVRAFLASQGHDGERIVEHAGLQRTLAEALSHSAWPSIEKIDGLSAQALADVLQPLPHREYSIASLPSDGALHLLLRQMHRPDGTLGLGSGWLTAHAAIGQQVSLRIRSNPGFHAPVDDRPLILIGNGTGMAGLRALMKSRIASRWMRNWLLFGERSRAHDLYYADELHAWQSQGWLERCDLTFSRDQLLRRYVQHAIAEQAADLQAWISQGAAVYVCGSLAGMAPAVDAEFARLIGRDALEQMAADGRYRRDVY